MRLGTLRLRWWRWATQQFRSVASLLADAAKRLTRPAHRPASRKRPYPLQLEGLEERGAPSSLAAPLGDDAPAGAPRAASLATTQLTRSLESSSTLDSNDTLLIPGSSSASDSGVLPLGSYAVLMNVGHSSDDAAWRYSFAGAAPAFQAALSDPLQLPAEFQSAPPHRFSDDLAKQLENNSKAAGTQAGAAGTNAATPSPHINAVIPAGTAAAQANSGAGSSALAQTSTAASMVGAPLATPPATPASAPPSSLAASLSGPSTAKPLTSSTTAVQPTAASTLQPATPSLQGLATGTYQAMGGQGGSDPLYVLDVNNDVVLPTSATPINTFSTWNMSLAAQVSGAAVSSYNWNFTQAPDAINITGASTYNTQFGWASFTSAARTDTISVTEFSSSGTLTQTYQFTVAPTGSPAFSRAPTSAATWPSVITPDQLKQQATVGAGPYASLGLADGSVQTSHSLPSYNPNVAPLGLVYNSTVANPQPIFLVRYQLNPSQSLPSSVTAQLTLSNGSGQTVFTGPTEYYNPSSLNPGDWMQMALQANASGLATGRYNWQIQVTAGGTPTTYSGAVNLVTASTTPTSLSNNPFGAGWSLDNVQRLYSASGGVMLQNPGGTSLWFANGGTAGTFTTPAGDFSTLTQDTTTGVYTRTLKDGTQINFNSSGQQTSIVDRNGNTTGFAYNGSGQLTSVTGMNGQVNTLTYNASGQLISITDPASRTLGLAYNGSNQLTSLTDPNNAVWTYGYDSSGDLTQLSDPRSNLTPPTPTYTTQFSYSSGRVSGVTPPDGTTEALTAVQVQGLGGTSSSPAAAVLLAAVSANYTDPNSQLWATYLDGLGLGQATENVDPLGDTSLTYRDGNGLGWLSADPLGRRERYFFDSQANVTQVVHADDSNGGSNGMASYNSFSEPVHYTDEMGNTWTYSYDPKGNLTQQENPLLYTESFAYNTAGLLTSMTDWAGNTWTYSFDSLNRKTGETDPLRYTQSWGYDTASNVTSTTNQDNVTDSYAYNNMGWLTQKTLPLSSTTSAIYSYGYDAVGNQTSVSVPLYYSGSTLVSATTTTAFDSLNRKTSVTDPLNDQTKYGYDAAGNLSSVTNPLGYETSYAFDPADRVTSVTIPLSGSGQQQVSATTTYGYDRAGEKISQTNALNQTTQYGYSVRGWLASVTDPLGNVTSYNYNYSGDRTQVTVSPHAGGTPALYTSNYDALHRLAETINPVGAQTSYVYDKDSNLTSVTGYNNGQGNMSYGYDPLNRKTSASDALGDTFSYSYDGVGNLVQQLNPLSYATGYAYNQQNWLTSSTDPLNGTTSYGYNLAGWKTAETDPDNNTTRYGYNNAGWLTSTTNPLNYQATYAYDQAGELTAQTDFNGQQTQYSYNEAGWKTGETWLNSNNQPIYQATYTFDKAGELTAAQDPNSSYGYGYDADGRQTQETVTYAGLSTTTLVTLSSGWDGYGNRTSLTDSLGGSFGYGYNLNHQLTTLSLSVSGAAVPQLTMSYDTQDRLSQVTRTLAGGMGSSSYDTITSTLGYDNANRLTGLTYTNSTTLTTLASFGYGYDAASQVTSTTGPEGSLSYGYDKTGQLTSVSGAQSNAYSFDHNGNRTMSGYSTGTGNELLNDGVFTYTYDDNGNVLTKTDASGDVWTNSWDYRNRVTEVKETNSSHQVVLDEKLTYDVNNQLIGVNVNGVQQRWTVFDGDNVLMDLSSSRAVTQRYLSDPTAQDVLYARVSASGTTNWYLTDRLGSVRQIVDTSGNTLDKVTYDAFGNILSETNASNGDRFKYDGGEYDSNLSLYRFGERWYSAAAGRWMSQDPLGLRPDTNSYRYVGNDPIAIVDPTGLLPVPGVPPYRPPTVVTPTQEETLQKEINDLKALKLPLSNYMRGLRMEINAARSQALKMQYKNTGGEMNAFLYTYMYIGAQLRIMDGEDRYNSASLLMGDIDYQIEARRMAISLRGLGAKVDPGTGRWPTVDPKTGKRVIGGPIIQVDTGALGDALRERLQGRTRDAVGSLESSFYGGYLFIPGAGYTLRPRIIRKPNP